MQETQETRVWALVQEDPLQEEMATHSRIPVFLPENPMDGGAQRSTIHGGAKELGMAE